MMTVLCTRLYAALLLMVVVVSSVSKVAEAKRGGTDGGSAALSSSSPFSIVIDGGSTGSRLHIFEFARRISSSAEGNDAGEEAAAGTEEGEEEVECVRRGSSKAYTPLSAYGRPPSLQHVPLDPYHVSAHLLPLFEYAAEIIPPEYHATTVVKYQATAGMRLLDDAEQEAVYDALFEGLWESETFVFRGMRREDVGTLGGDLEGFYGAVAANYLKGLVDTGLRMKTTAVSNKSVSSAAREEDGDCKDGEATKEEEDDDEDQWYCTEDAEGHHHEHHGPLGALDMGGSSTQIVYLPGGSDLAGSNEGNETCSPSDPHDEDSDDDMTCTNTDFAQQPPPPPTHLNGDDFFSTSHLSYGVDQFRERLWDTWVNDRKESERQASDCDRTCLVPTKVITNPCGFKGHEIEWDGHILLGSGDAEKCAEQVLRLIPHHEDVVDETTDAAGSATAAGVVGGVEHPPLRGKFFAMSLYFFTLDSLRVLSHPDADAHEALNLSWPTPSIEELYNALHGLCSRSWQGDLEDIQHSAHEFTRAEVLPHRCVESVYMVTLLRDGFGFHPNSRDITFTFLVEGSEVEWSLGMALVMFAEGGEDAAVTTVVVDGNQDDDDDETEDEEEEDEALDWFECSAEPPCDDGSDINVTNEDDDVVVGDCRASSHQACPATFSLETSAYIES